MSQSHQRYMYISLWRGSVSHIEVSLSRHYLIMPSIYSIHKSKTTSTSSVSGPFPDMPGTSQWLLILTLPFLFLSSTIFLQSSPTSQSLRSSSKIYSYMQWWFKAVSKCDFEPQTRRTWKRSVFHRCIDATSTLDVFDATVSPFKSSTNTSWDARQLAIWCLTCILKCRGANLFSFPIETSPHMYRSFAPRLSVASSTLRWKLSELRR